MYMYIYIYIYIYVYICIYTLYNSQKNGDSKLEFIPPKQRTRQ